MLRERGSKGGVCVSGNAWGALLLGGEVGVIVDRNRSRRQGLLGKGRPRYQENWFHGSKNGSGLRTWRAPRGFPRREIKKRWG